SGAVALSRDPATPLVLNIDIGGGTTKLAVCRDGRVDETAALDLGARVVSWDRSGLVRSVTHAGARIAHDANVRIAVGDKCDETTLDAIVDRIAHLTLLVPRGSPLDASLWLTQPLVAVGPFHTLVFSGGVGEYINRTEKTEFGDLGLRLGKAIGRRLGSFQVLRPVESIRATCIGASQYSVQVSGDT